MLAVPLSRFAFAVMMPAAVSPLVRPSLDAAAPYAITVPSWSPDSRRIAFVSNSDEI